MPHFLGFDVSKDTLDACLTTNLGEPLWFDKLPNDPDAIAEYLLMVQGATGPFVAMCESTATYHFDLVEAAFAAGIPCRILNPLHSHQAIKSSLRGSKSDKTDALAVARCGARGDGRLAVPDAFEATKYLVRSHAELTNLATAFGLHAGHARERLDTTLSPAADALLTEMAEQFRTLRATLIRDAGAHAPLELLHLLQTIPGIGPVTAATLIGELGDPTRFKSAKSLVAFAGLDPRSFQSGKALRHNGHLAKRGSAHLRRALFMAAHSARRADPALRLLYERKRSEGRSYTEAVCIVSRKLLLICRAVWLSGQDYDAAYAASPRKNA